jgi:uncharacterized protein (DUF302 family)
MSPTALVPVPSSDPGRHLHAHWPLPFAEALPVLRDRITANGLLELGLVDTTRILMGAGLAIPQIRQLLAFHPRFMRRILETDSAGLVEAPLKFSIVERATSTELRCADPGQLFAPYDGLAELGRTLRESALTILDLSR